LSLSSTDPLDPVHLRKLKHSSTGANLRWYRTSIVGAVDGAFLNDLLPLPYTEEALDHAIGGVDKRRTISAGGS
jgi:uncharacterized protein (UPF0276 family)